MESPPQLVDGVAQSGKLHGAGGGDQESCAGRAAAEGGVFHIHAVAVFLGHDVGDEHLFCSSAELAGITASLAVAVVFPWPQTEVLDLVEGFGELQSDTQPGETLKLCGDLIFKCRFNGAVGKGSETLEELQLFLNDAGGADDGVEFNGVMSDPELIGGFLHLIQTFFQPLPEHTRLAAGVFALAAPVGTVVEVGLEDDTVVVGGGTPQIEGESLLEQFHPLVFQREKSPVVE